jgi:hypothetical protein
MTHAPGVISASEIYTLREAMSRLKLGRHSLRSLRRAGLRTLVVGRNHYVDGAELIALIKTLGAENRQKAEAKAVAENERERQI